MNKIDVNIEFIIELYNNDFQSQNYLSIGNLEGNYYEYRYEGVFYKGIYIKNNIGVFSFYKNNILFMGVTIDDNTYYMINEYLIGGNLSEKIKKGKLSEQQKIKIALQIDLALKYIHSKNILHCDVKSSNAF